MIYPNIRYNFYWHGLVQCYRFYNFFETKKRLAGFSEQFCQKQTEILYILYWRVQYSLLWYMSIRLSGSSACLCVHLYLEVFANLFFFLLWYARTNTDKHIHAQTHTYEHTHARAHTHTHTHTPHTQNTPRTHYTPNTTYTHTHDIRNKHTHTHKTHNNTHSHI